MMLHEPSMPAGQPSETHTPADVDRAIRGLGGEGWRRLRTAARDSLDGVEDPLRDPEDLLNEALTRLLDGRRTWKRKVGFEYQMARSR